MAYDKSINVSQLTVDSMKKLGMKAAIDRANSGTAGAEFTEAAKRFYGNRITGGAKPAAGGPKMRPTGPTPHVTEVPVNNNRPGPVVQARANMKAETTQKPYGKNESAM